MSGATQAGAVRDDTGGAEAPPRVALFLFGGSAPDSYRPSLAGLPEGLRDLIEELVLVPDEAAGELERALPALADEAGLALRIHRTPARPGYGSVRKSAFEYALLRGFDLVVTMQARGVHPPGELPRLLAAALEEPRSLVVAARRMRAGEPGVRGSHLLAHSTATGIQNRLLGLRLGDYHSGFRVYPARLLGAVPFQLNSDGRPFDMEIVIQCRALGMPIREVEMPPAWREYPSSPRGLWNVVRFSAAAVDYRLHQLHVIRQGRYFVEPDVHYTLKHSPTGSHMQLVEAIAPGSRVLDLGCSQGLLSGPLREQGVSVTGVDVDGSRPAEALEAFYERDLEQPLELPLERDFDYVVCSDVIEHLRNRTELLRGVRRYLKPEGRLLISTPNVALWFYRLSLLVGRFEYGARGVLDETHVHLYTRSSFRRSVERAGFRIVRERVTALPFEVVFESTGRSGLIRNLAAAYHLLARLWPAMFAYQVILEAEITTLDEESTYGP